MKLEVHISNQHLTFVVIFFLALAFVGVAGAYNLPATGGDPETMGHSSDEVEVTIHGVQYTMQEAIDLGLIAGDLRYAAVNVFGFENIDDLVVTLDNLNTGDVVRADIICSATVLARQFNLWVELDTGAAGVLLEPNVIDWRSGASAYYNSGGGVSTGLYQVTSPGALTFSAAYSGSVNIYFDCSLLAYVVNQGVEDLPEFGTITLENCAWETTSWDAWTDCSSATAVVRGVQLCPRGGHRDFCKIRCCDKVIG